MIELQNYNKTLYDKHHKNPRIYKIGDYVMIKNIDVTPNVNKKLIPKYKGPYRIDKILPNDRFVIKDIDGFQVTQMPFDGVLDSSRIKPWLPSLEYDSSEQVTDLID